MNRAKLKSYAPKARKEFLRAVSDRARKVGLTLGHTEPVEVRGDMALIGGQAFPKRVADQRRRLDEQIRRKGFTAVMEEVAYTWFNRFMAIRYMEVHGYLEHGYRVLSHPDGKDRPEILEQAENVTLPGLDKGMVIDLKLDGTKDEELYKLMLLGQCHALHLAMPFLFERIDDQTELLLPDNLLSSDSVIRKMVTEIAEEDWQQIEIIGWLYQFYISEKKDTLMAAKKAYASEDIPAVTQLFTPNWIVKYMVQNSLGRQWLATYPHSPLREQMEYYIEPAEQTEDVTAQLAAITPKELDPEALTLIDPACGSGHILVEAYDLFKEIYLERGYRLRDIPRLILEKNLFGLEIDDRAAQMAGFALLMKARADDRSILTKTPMLNVRAIQSSAGLDATQLASALLTPKTVELVPSHELFPETQVQPALVAEENIFVRPRDIRNICELFADAKTFGSLITVPAEVISALPHFRSLFETSQSGSDLLARQAADEMEPLVVQADLLARQHDVSVMNPPYLGGKGMNTELKSFASKNYPNGKSDLFAMFIERGFDFVRERGYNTLVTMQSWMFLSSFLALRESLLEKRTIEGLVHMANGVMGIAFGTAATVFRNESVSKFVGTFSYVNSADLTSNDVPCEFPVINERYAKIAQSEFNKIPGSPIAYWVSDTTRSVFTRGIPLSTVADLKVGMATSDNNRFLRYWYEVNASRVKLNAASHEEATNSGKKWFPYSKGGESRKWYGNNYLLVNWENGGAEVIELARQLWGSSSKRIYNAQFFFKAAITWSLTSSSAGGFTARWRDAGFIFDVNGMSSFVDGDSSEIICAVNSRVGAYLLGVINPTMAFQAGDLCRFPLIRLRDSSQVKRIADQAIALSREDWNSRETAWDFDSLSLIDSSDTVKLSFQNWVDCADEQRTKIRQLEEENNRLFIAAYGLEDEIVAEVPDDQITLAYAEREYDMRRLISTSLGCMMGRYSLDKPGLIYAHSGNEGFDPSRYATFPADADGILPLTDTDWFGEEDTANRFGDFLKAAWPAETYHENVQFVADSLSAKAGEAPMDTIRRYLATGFYKDHLQTYKKRPIYWLFSSGKERAFQALVYLHRYNEGTLARMRMEYVVPLQSRLSARIEQIDVDITNSTSTVDRKKREGERAKLSRQYLELLAFDEKLRHYADQRIHLDLDDGVKVNYGKFGDLLAEVKAITGDKDE